MVRNQPVLYLKMGTKSKAYLRVLGEVCLKSGLTLWSILIAEYKDTFPWTYLSFNHLKI